MKIGAGSLKVCRATFVPNVLIKDVCKPAQTSCCRKAGHMQMRMMGNKDAILLQRAADPTKTFSSATT